jgi:PhzF family phenazine biosynthesis protein
MAMTAISVEHWEVFAREPGGGNPCYLIRATEAVAVEAAQLAARQHGAEAAIVVVEEAGIALRFFSPGGEMAMCGHATIAAVTALVAAGELEGTKTVARTSAGSFPVGWDDDRPPLVSIDHLDLQIGPAVAATGEVAGVLGVPADQLAGGDLRVVSIARAKLLVPLVDAEAVHAARPDPDRLAELCRATGATGAYVFAPHPDGRPNHLVARQFPVDAGMAEDPATGVAAGALAAYLASASGWSDIEVDQGDAMGRPSRLQARAFAADGAVSRVQVAGRAQLIGQERLEL